MVDTMEDNPYYDMEDFGIHNPYGSDQESAYDGTLDGEIVEMNETGEATEEFIDLIKKRDASFVLDFFDNGLEPNLIDPQSNMSIVFTAVIHSSEIVEVLVNYDAYFNVVDSEEHGDTPLHYAVYYGNIESCESLLRANGIGNIIVDINKQNKNGQTPLYYSVKYKHVDIFLLLLENGADINIATNSDETPTDLINSPGYRSFKYELRRIVTREKQIRSIESRFQERPSLVTRMQRSSRGALTRRKKKRYQRYKGMTSVDPFDPFEYDAQGNKIDDIDISRFLFQDRQNFVVKMGDDNYFALNVNDLQQMNTYNVLDEQGRDVQLLKVFYECKQVYEQLYFTEEEIVDKTPYFKIPPYSTVILLPDWLDYDSRYPNTKRIPEPKVFELVPYKVVPALLSSDLLNREGDMISSDHCNHLEPVQIYRLEIVDLEQRELEETSRFLEDMSMYGGKKRRLPYKYKRR